MSKILEIHIQNYDKIPINEWSNNYLKKGEFAWGLIKDLHDLYLHKDPCWHFFWEGKYNIIRFSEEYLGDINKHLGNLDLLEYEYKGEWKDNSEVVEKYKENFISLFHNFSEIAIKGYEKGEEQYYLIDRVIHCFMNHQFFNMKEEREKYGDKWEAHLIAENLISRAYYNGYCYARNASKSE